MRSALLAALTDPDAPADPAPPAHPAPPAGSAPLADLAGEDLLAAVVAVVERWVAPVVASHGGSVHVHSVVDGVLTVELSGACTGCPASQRTLSALVLAQVRERLPQVRQVRSARPGGARQFTLPWVRRRQG